MGYSLRSGFPHSDISGSKLHCQLPRAFRRLARPSSPVIAKASTTCTYSLDPITLSSLARSRVTGNSFVRPPVVSKRPMQSQPYCGPLHASYKQRLTRNTSLPSSILLKSVQTFNPSKELGVKSDESSHAALYSLLLTPDFSQAFGGG